MWAGESDLVSNASPKSVGFSLSIEINLVSAWVVEVDLISVILTRSQCRDDLFYFMVGDRN